jgi:outer membrane immunogenic protein
MNRVALIVAISMISTSTMASAGSHDILGSNLSPEQTSAQASGQGSGWTGFYVGGQLGIVDSELPVPLSDLVEGGFLTEEVITDAGFGLDDAVTIGLDGKSYGVHVGYMHDAGSYVLGGEFDYNSLDFDEVSIDVGGTKVTESIDDDSDDSIMRLKLRAGYDAGQFLPYVTVGMARIDSEDESTNGTFYGAGVEVLATGNFMIGGEILQHQFDDAFDSGLDIEATTMSLRASYKF